MQKANSQWYKARNGRWFMLAALFTVIATLVAACGESGSTATTQEGSTESTERPGTGSETTAQPDQGELVAFTFGAPSAAQIPQMFHVVGRELGYYEDHGLDLQIEVGVQDPFSSLRQGQLDNASGAIGGLLRVLADDPEAGLRAMFNYLPHTNMAWGVHPDSPIQTLDDVESGVRIGVQLMATGATEQAIAELRSIGIDPDTEVEWVITPDPATMARAVESDEIDILVYHITSSQAPTHRALGYDLRSLPHAEGFDQLGGAVLIATEDAMAERSDDYVGYIEGYLQTWAFIQENPEGAIDIMLNEFPELIEPGESREDAIERNVAIVRDGWNVIQQAPEWAVPTYGDNFGVLYPEAFELVAEVDGIDADTDLAYTNEIVDAAWETVDLETGREDARNYSMGG